MDQNEVCSCGTMYYVLFLYILTLLKCACACARQSSFNRIFPVHVDGWDGDGRRVSPPKQRVHFVSFDGQVRNSGDMAILAGEIFKHQQRSPKFVLRGNSAALLSSAAAAAAEPKTANLISTHKL